MALNAFDDEAITVSNAAVGVTDATAGLGTSSPAKRAVLTVETAQIRFRYDGTAATAAVGHIGDPGDMIIIEGTGNINNLSMIRTGASDAAVHVTYER